MAPPGTDRSRNEAEKEARLQAACYELAREKQNGLKINIKAKASEFKVSYTTLHGRFRNFHKPRVEAHANQQFLSAAHERVLVLWIKHLGSTGFPLCKRAIKIRAQELHPDKKKPGANWIYAFLRRHPDRCAQLKKEI
jgi:Tc5 transposase DNA-binding domain